MQSRKVNLANCINQQSKCNLSKVQKNPHPVVPKQLWKNHKQTLVTCCRRQTLKWLVVRRSREANPQCTNLTLRLVLRTHPIQVSWCSSQAQSNSVISCNRCWVTCKALSRSVTTGRIWSRIYKRSCYWQGIKLRATRSRGRKLAMRRVRYKISLRNRQIMYKIGQRMLTKDNQTQICCQLTNSSFYNSKHLKKQK